MFFNVKLGVSEIPAGAKIIYREAVRGVVVKDQDLLFMIHTINGDYKFPGGGLEAGEDHKSALTREFIEETGYAIKNEIRLIGLITEQKLDAYEQDAYFVMKSYYYSCEIIGDNIGQNLDQYEKELNFKAGYVLISDVYTRNKHLLESKSSTASLWLLREVTAIEHIMRQFNLMAEKRRD